MHATMRRWTASDEGVSLIELVIAALILFIAVTAVFGLILKAMDMSIQAKQQNIGLSVGSSYIEQVRALPYEAVGVVGGSVPGSLSVSTTMTISNFQVTVTPDVVMVDDPWIGPNAYKSLTVTVTVDAPGVARPITRVVRTFIRKAETMAAGHEVPGALRIAYDSAMPARNSYVQQVMTIPFTATNSNTAVLITTLDILGTHDKSKRGGWLTGSGGPPESPEFAQWANVDANTISKVFSWDTARLLTDGVTREWPDGPYVLEATAQDAVGNIAHTVWTVVVDNDPPSGVATMAPPVYYKYAPSRADLSYIYNWDLVYDGYQTETYQYVLHAYREHKGADPALAPWENVGATGWDDLGDTTILAPRRNHSLMSGAADYFSRYEVLVEPKSYFGRTAGARDMPVPFVSRPKMTATSTVTYDGAERRFTTTTGLRMRGAQFTTSGRTITLYRSALPNMSGAVAVKSWTTDEDTYDHVDTVVGGKNALPVTYYYQMTCVMTPSGWRGGSPFTAYSAVLGPTPVQLATNETLVETW